ncbi:MAG: hypothetical protein HQ469_12850 [Cyanobacteria bacterium]|nr:hypothetical protein [Cyanobacteria bacterium bin.275]
MAPPPQVVAAAAPVFTPVEGHHHGVAPSEASRQLQEARHGLERRMNTAGQYRAP